MTLFALLLMSTVILVLVVLALLAFGVYVALFDSGSIHLGNYLPGTFADLEQFQKEEERALLTMDEQSKQSYLSAKRWIDQNPPNSADTEMSLTQHLTIQDLGVSAWEFQYDRFNQYNVLIENRTELEFRSNEMVSVQTNLPLPKQREVYYWEIKIYEMDPEGVLAVGLTTKPYPVFRLPGMHRFSVSYESTGHRRLNQPFTPMRYGRKWRRGDVIGVGYRSRTGVVFFTHNGRKLDDVVEGMKVNLFPTVGSTRPANIYVNFGQGGFVYLQANVKGWGLAPQQGSLAPPPAYGDQGDSLLLESTNNLDNAPPYLSRQNSMDVVPYVDDPNQSIHSNEQEVPRSQSNQSNQSIGSTGSIGSIGSTGSTGSNQDEPYQDNANQDDQDIANQDNSSQEEHQSDQEEYIAEEGGEPEEGADLEEDLLEGEDQLEREEGSDYLLEGEGADDETEAETETEHTDSETDTETLGNAETETLTNQ